MYTCQGGKASCVFDNPPVRGLLRGEVLAVPPRPAAFCFQAMDINDDADIRAFWDDLQRTTGSRSSSWDTFAATFEVGSMRRRWRGDSERGDYCY